MFDLRNLYNAIIILCFGVGILTFFCWCTGCSTSNPMPYMDIKTWAGDSSSGSVQRTQNNEDNQIKCTDPRFDEMVSMRYDDLRLIYGTLIQCRSW